MLALLSLFLFVAVIVWVAAKDRTQKEHAILRNYPVIGHLRYFFEDLGKYFRQYWFTNDSEEQPFSRSVRSQVYRMSKDQPNVLSFGSSSEPKKEIFSPTMYPLEPNEADTSSPITIGKDCEFPFTQKRLVAISGMSFGALSANAISALSKGAALAGITMTTGEGGLPSRYHLSEEMLNSKEGGLVLQIGTANFGFRNRSGLIDYEKILKVRHQPYIKWIQIKLSQGAKPGKGGILPANKVTPEIAELRGVEAGKVCISPSKNPECETPEKLLNTIKRIKTVTGKPVGIKLALADVEELSKLIELAKKKDVDNQGPSYLPSVITVDGGDGGTGAAPAVFMESIALRVNEVLSQVHSMLIQQNVRDKVSLVASGKLVTAHDAGIAFSQGADWIESARGFMMSLGCINALECSTDKCSVGIATQDPKRQMALDPESKKHRVHHFAKNLEKEIFDLSLACGISHPRKFRDKEIKKIIHTKIIN